jgi:signal transduction histidine kinase
MAIRKYSMDSIAVRQALLSTLVTLVAVIFLAIAAGFAIERSSLADMQQTIDTDIVGLADIMANGGESELRLRIADRTMLLPGTAPLAYYGLADAKGARLAGNLAVPPRLDADHSQASEIQRGEDRILLRATRLRGGLTLVVGRSLRGIEALQQRVEIDFLIVGAIAVFTTLVAGFAVAARLRGRVEALTRTFAGFERGDRAARIAAASGRDELAQLAGQVDAHLDWTARLLTSQREISDNIAHELRTPLVHLDTRLLSALANNSDNAVASELHLARSDIRSIVSLFDALLDLTLAETGHAAASTASFDLSEVAADLAELYAASAEEAALDFKARITPGVVMRGELMAITRMIANLLDNAFKYVPAGSKVRLIVTAGPRIVVEDNGTGIAATDAEQVFLRFRRAAKPETGHGLGLALVKIIAARHGLLARIEDARPGARFIIESDPAPPNSGSA